VAANGYLIRLQKLHASLVLRRRENVLAHNIAGLLPEGVTSLLDVGCGDGVISRAVADVTPGLQVEGVEVLDRVHCDIPYSLFDGETLPHDDEAFDCVSFVDVLHHTADPDALIAEATRVSRHYIVIKDHIWSNRFDRFVLGVMDWVGNRSYSVHLNYNYLHDTHWQKIFARNGLSVVGRNEDLGLYPFPFNLLFERGKHFLVLLEKTTTPKPQ
jgi:SAM-dependent methyltransferase